MCVYIYLYIYICCHSSRVLTYQVRHGFSFWGVHDTSTSGDVIEADSACNIAGFRVAILICLPFHGA